MSAPSFEGVSALNALPEVSFRAALHPCCSNAAYVNGMVSRRPFADENALFEASHSVWDGLSQSDRLEALAAHPRIGEVREKDENKSEKWSKGEQARVADASRMTKMELERMNHEYFEKHGFTFVICATGKSAEEIRDQLKERLGNDTEKEMEEAATEQLKITEVRLRKLLNEIVVDGK